MRGGLLAPILLLLAACPSATPVDLTLAQDAEPQTLDPARMTGVTEGRIAGALFEGLTRLDAASLRVLPGVASEWGVSPDGRTWTFRLRPDARWSDGRPVTAGDFRYSWLRLLGPATAASYAGLLFPVRGARAYQRGEAGPDAVGIEARDDRTLVVTLDQPVPYFPSIAAFFSLSPVPRWVLEAHGDRWTRPDHLVGNGPFVLRQHRFYREIVLARSESYWDREHVRLQSLRLVPVPDPNTQLNLYITGEVDLAFSLPGSVAAALRARPDSVTGPRLATAFLRVNTTRPPLDRPEVRSALARVLDREALVTRITRGGEPAAHSFVPPVLPDYPPAAGPGHDPETARRLLAEAGYPGGAGFPPLSLSLSQNPDHAAVAAVLQQTFRSELGIEVRIDVREWKVYLSSMKALEYDLAFSQWIGDYPDETTFLDCFRTGNGNNRTGWSDPAYDTALDQAATPAAGEETATWLARRTRLHQGAERRLLDSAPLLLLYHPVVRALVSPRIRGFAPNVMGLVLYRDLFLAEEESSSP